MSLGAKLLVAILVVLGTGVLASASSTWQLKEPIWLAAYVVPAITASVRQAGWQSALLLTPVAFLLYRTYRLHVGRVEAERLHAEQMASLHLRTIESLALAIEAKDNTTHDHLKRVQVYASEIGKELGLSPEELEALQAAAVLHDIGKLAVPEHIISKPGKLTPAEFEKMKIHPVVGAEILEHVQFPYPVVPIVRSHHEKWDGTGYPYGLRGDNIPVGARILAVVDALDALASDRQYRRALPLSEAMAKVEKESGRSFDPQVVEVLKRRHVELEKKAQAVKLGVVKLSTDLKIERGAAPAAGFASGSTLNYKPATGPAAVDLMQRIGWARRDLSGIFTEGSSSEALSLEERLALFSMRLKKLLPFEAIAIYFIEDRELVPAYVSGDNYKLFSSLRIPVGQGLSGWVAENRKPILNGNPSVEPGYLNNPSIFSTLRSALSVPLIGGSGVIGTVSLYHEARDAFSQEHMRLLQAIAPKLALSIELLVRRQRSSDAPLTAQHPAPASGNILDRINQEILRARRSNAPLTVVVCSVENCSGVTRQMSPAEAPGVMRSILAAIQDHCRESDFIGRINEHEFVVVMPGIAPRAAEEKAANFMQAAVAAGVSTISVVAGQGVYPQDGNDAETLLCAADRRLFGIRQSRMAAV